MPPRKRARVSETSTPKGSADVAAEGTKSVQKEDILKDPWTDDEETLLFKSMIRWKPTGIHKHFRMLAISNALSSHGFTSPATPHTRIPGIWAKLRVLYDLDALDERENSHAGILSSPPLTPDSENASDEEEEDEEEERDTTWNHEFELPGEEYGEMMWERRFPAQDDRSAETTPEAIEGLNHTRSEAGVDLSAMRAHDEEEMASFQGKGKKTAASKAIKGKAGVRSTGLTPAEEAEEENDEEEEEEESQKKGPAKSKPVRPRRRR